MLNAKIGFGKSTNWLSSGIGYSGMIVREQPRITTVDESISMSAPRGTSKPILATQESVNEPSKQSTGQRRSPR